MTDGLDNPFWASLATRHRDHAIASGEVRRYPPEVAPFLGVADADADTVGTDALVPAGDTAYLLGVLPRFGPAWSVHAYAPLAQMVCDVPIAPRTGPPIVPLGEVERPDVLALTALVYPHYFRPRTMALGRYFGIYLDGRLAAMIGERLGTESRREVSAVCTHPDFLGRGLARQLLAFLTNDLLAQGLQPFLHVSHQNVRAKTLYGQEGYRLRRDIGFWSVRRRADEA